MLGRLLPRELGFFDYFERHAERTREGADLLVRLFLDPARAETMVERIKEVEHEGDTITHSTIEMLHRTWITPLDRDEIHRLITRLDDILDYVDATAQRVLLYEIKESPPEAVELARVLLQACEQVVHAVKGLRDLRDPKKILSLCVDINRIENEADQLLRKATSRLFKEGKDPLYIIKWKEIYETLETATDRCEDVANVIEGVVLEHA